MLVPWLMSELPPVAIMLQKRLPAVYHGEHKDSIVVLVFHIENTRAIK